MTQRIAAFNQRAVVARGWAVLEHGQRTVAKPHVPRRTVPAEKRTVEQSGRGVVAQNSPFLALARRNPREADPPPVREDQLAPRNTSVAALIVVKFDMMWIAVEFDTSLIVAEYDMTLIDVECDVTLIVVDFDMTLMAVEFDTTLIAVEFDSLLLVDEFGSTLIVVELETLLVLVELEMKLIEDEIKMKFSNDEFKMTLIS